MSIRVGRYLSSMFYVNSLIYIVVFTKSYNRYQLVVPYVVTSICNYTIL